MKKKNKGGRKPIDIDLYYTKIKGYLQRGFSVRKSCILANVPATTISDYMIADEKFSDKIKADQEYASAMARDVLLEKLRQKNEDVAKWWLERKSKDEFSTRQEQDINNSTTTELKIKII